MPLEESRRRELIESLTAINEARVAGSMDAPEPLAATWGDPAVRLAVYGSLAPGEVNHHVIADIPGDWTQGFVRGTVHMKGWGSHFGFPGMTWEPRSAERIPIRLFSSPELPRHWDRIDDFEGDGYLRILVPVEGVGDAPIVANIYQLREGASRA